MDAVRTERMLLVPSDESLARAEADRRDEFLRRLGVEACPDWPPELSDENTIAYNLRQLYRGGESAVGWWCWYFVLLQDDRRRLVGNGGFKGPPDADGEVELGYALLRAHRGAGLAVEAVQGLCAWAAEHGARRATILTLESLPASIRVAQRAGFQGPFPEGGGAVRLRRELAVDARDRDQHGSDARA